MEDGFTDIISIALAAAMIMFPVKDVLEQPMYSLTYEEATESRILNDESFTPVAWSSRPYKVLDDQKGYVYINSDVSRALYTENSRLYLIHVYASFTPGYVAAQNGMSGYGGNNYLHSGFIHLTVINTEASDHVDAASKAMWPQSDDFITTFTSTYGFELNVANAIEAGISIGNGGILSAGIGGQNETSMKLAFTRSVSTVSDDPFLSAQYAGDRDLSATWSFEVINDEIAGKATYNLEVFYLIEVSPKNEYNDKVEIELSIGFKTIHKVLGIPIVSGLVSKDDSLMAVYM